MKESWKNRSIVDIGTFAWESVEKDKKVVMILRRAEQQNLHVIGNGYEFFFVEESSSNHGHGENFSREDRWKR